MLVTSPCIILLKKPGRYYNVGIAGKATPQELGYALVLGIFPCHGFPVNSTAPSGSGARAASVK
jgi:hypothetical protein